MSARARILPLPVKTSSVSPHHALKDAMLRPPQLLMAWLYLLKRKHDVWSFTESALLLWELLQVAGIKAKAEKAGDSTVLKLKELNAEKRSVEVGIRGFCVSWWLFREHHTASSPGCYNFQCYYSFRVSHVCELEFKKKKIYLQVNASISRAPQGRN